MHHSKRIGTITISLLASLITLTTVGIQANAHHGWSEYKDKQTLNLTGKIRSVRYDNPHTVIELETSDKI
jgi:hypothetical protein